MYTIKRVQTKTPPPYTHIHIRATKERGREGKREAEKGREEKREGADRGEGGRREWDIGITEAWRAVYTSAYKQMLSTQREQTKHFFFLLISLS